MKDTPPRDTALNAICPYFTMFPLQFPLEILSRRAQPTDVVLDPFCGRGTTNYAARLLGLRSIGLDASPVATAITAAKLVGASPAAIVCEAAAILRNADAVETPRGEFWEAAYHPEVLRKLAQLRQSLILDCVSPERVALRGIMLGALHGPQQVSVDSYLSNQAPRTYAPKPAYAVKFWKKRELVARNVDVLQLIERRAKRFYQSSLPAIGSAVLTDSRRREWTKGVAEASPQWIITSPPYYGMRTYIPDQWLRSWFVGGKDVVDYSTDGQIGHRSPDIFASDLRSVWLNVQDVSAASANLIILFGGISDRAQEPLSIIRRSLEGTNWELTAAEPAGDASDGKRQANTFLRKASKPVTEYIIWASNRQAGQQCWQDGSRAAA